MPFDQDTWILDPTRPRLIDMLTPREILWMRKEKPATRVMMVANDLGCNIQRLAVHLIFDREFVQATTSNMQGLLDSYKACARIVDTPIPFPYAHMLAFILFVFVYFSPFVYMLSNSNPLLGVIPSVLLVLAYYGIEEVSIAIENPFDWDECDHDLEVFGRAIHDETRAIGGGSATTDYMPRTTVESQGSRLRQIEAMVESAGHRAAQHASSVAHGVAHGVAHASPRAGSSANATAE